MVEKMGADGSPSDSSSSHLWSSDRTDAFPLELLPRGLQWRRHPSDKQVWRAVASDCPALELQSCMELNLPRSQTPSPGIVGPVVNETVFGALGKSGLKEHFLVLIRFI